MTHRTGLHLRAAGRLAEIAQRFTATVRLSACGQDVNAKSVLDLLRLGAGPGIQLLFVADGADAEEALNALEELVRNNFDEDTEGGD